MDQFNLTPWQKGDKLDHNRFNLEQNALKEALHRLGVSTVTGANSPQQFDLLLADHFWGLTTETPPSEQAAFTDAQYFVKRGLLEYRNTIQIQGSIVRSVDRIGVPIVEPNTSLQETVVATNVSELPPNPTLITRGTHYLPAGTPVHVFAFISRTTPTLKVYTFEKFMMPPAQYENMALISRADHSWGASLIRISESNELP